MKFVKNYKLFLEQDEVEIKEPEGSETVVKDNEEANKEALKTIQTDLAWYRQKKGVMEAIFKDIEKDEADINKQLQKDVYKNERDMKKRNRYLKELESVYILKRKADKLLLQIQKDQGRTEEVRKQMNELQDTFNQLDNVTQKGKVSERIEKSREYLKTLNQTILFNKSEYAKIDKNYKSKKTNFESMMRIEEQKIKNLLQK